jgi:hypothetical protein
VLSSRFALTASTGWAFSACRSTAVREHFIQRFQVRPTDLDCITFIPSRYCMLAVATWIPIRMAATGLVMIGWGSLFRVAACFSFCPELRARPSLAEGARGM